MSVQESQEPTAPSRRPVDRQTIRNVRRFHPYGNGGRGNGQRSISGRGQIGNRTNLRGGPILSRPYGSFSNYGGGFNGNYSRNFGQRFQGRFNSGRLNYNARGQGQGPSNFARGRGQGSINNARGPGAAPSNYSGNNRMQSYFSNENEEVYDNVYENPESQQENYSIDQNNVWTDNDGNVSFDQHFFSPSNDVGYNDDMYFQDDYGENHQEGFDY